MGRPLNASSSCMACASAKRKCGKEWPHCLRCWSRRIECRYPRPKPSNFVPLDDGELELQHLPMSLNPSQWLPSSGTHAVDRPSNFGSSKDDLASWWFNSPETWVIDHAPEEAKSRTRSALELNHAIKTVHQWLSWWVDGHGNPFIHQNLYRHRFPRCMQDAYTALSCYLHRKPSNEQAVLQIIQDRAQQLVGQDSFPADTLSETLGVGSARLDPLGHLARAQALLVYQLIGLYDGNIRLRCVAERHIPVLMSWMQQAVNQASNADSLGGFLLSPSPREATHESLPWEQLVWYSWILAESLRRTWLVVSAIHGVYFTKQHGGAHCLGGMIFTSRRGFWEAPSALSWQKRCSEIYGGMVRLTETNKLFTLVAPEDLDDFAKLVLQVTFGMEQMEKWGVETSFAEG